MIGVCLMADGCWSLQSLSQFTWILDFFMAHGREVRYSKPTYWSYEEVEPRRLPPRVASIGDMSHGF